MKRIILLSALLCASLNLMAIRAHRTLRTVSQPDGTTLTMQLHGDETFHYYATPDGQPLVRGNDGAYRYATVSDGKLIATDIVAHDAAHRTAAEHSFIQFAASNVKSATSDIWNQRIAKRNAQRAQRNARRLAPRRVGESSATTGHKKGLVILVNFTDVKMNANNTQQAFYDQFNQEGYSKNQHIGSVRDYFRDQSYGQLLIDFDVVGPYTLANPMAYYGQDIDGEGNDAHATDMVKEACLLAQNDVDYADYDWDGDKEVEQVYVIYAGYGQSWGADANTIWPHQWQLQYGTGSSLTLDGVTVDTYACSNELYGTTGGDMDAIGTACHEFSHCLGLPDFYDTSSTNFGMSVWSLMDYGCYNGTPDFEGNSPCSYTAYERMFSGWLTPTELTEGTSITGMKPLSDASAKEAYIIYNDNNRNEYYLLQNTQKTGWDRYQFGHGLMVIHIDYNETAWTKNTVNNVASRQRCTIIPADNDLSENTGTELAGDLFPGLNKTTQLTDTSKPAATLYNANTDGAKLMHKPITEIAETNGLVSFLFMGGKLLDTPKLSTTTADSTATDEGHTLNVSWEAVDGAESYSLELREVAQVSATRLLSERFDGIRNITNDGLDLSTKLDTYLSTSGWTGSKLFHGWLNSVFHGIKLGSSKASGYLQSPLYDAPETGTVSLYVEGEPYNQDALTLAVSIVGADGQTLATQTLTSQGGVLVQATDVSTGYRIYLSSGAKRAFVGLIALYDGEIDESTAAEDNAVLEAPRRASAQLIEGITGTSYVFSGLTAPEYTLRIRAISADGSSAWSDRLTITFDDGANGISALTASQMKADTPVSVYTLAGQVVRTATWANWSHNLPAGTYIIRSTHGSLKAQLR